MRVESRDSVSLKPAELDELGQLARLGGAPAARTTSSTTTSSSSRWSSLSTEDDELHGFLFGSLERIGGTPVHPLGPRRGPAGPRRPGRRSRASSASSTAGPRSRSPTRTCSWPVASRSRRRTRCSAALTDVCPRPKYSPNGEERAWGRRLARRFGCDARYDDRTFRVKAGKARRARPRHAATSSSAARRRPRSSARSTRRRARRVIAFGWAMAEELADGLGRPTASASADPPATASSWARRSSGSVTGRRHAKRSQTYAVGCPSTRPPLGEQRSAAPAPASGLTRSRAPPPGSKRPHDLRRSARGRGRRRRRRSRPRAAA